MSLSGRVYQFFTYLLYTIGKENGEGSGEFTLVYDRGGDNSESLGESGLHPSQYKPHRFTDANRTKTV